MKILYTSDIHASDTHLFSMLSVAEREEVDCIIIGGDIVPHALPDSVTAGPLRAQAIYLEDVFIPAIQNLKKKMEVTIYLDLGNDDFICNRTILEDYDGNLLDLLHFRKNKLTDDIDIIGYMNVPPTPFTRKDWERPDSVKQTFAPGNDITLRGYTSASGMLQQIIIDLSSDDTIEKDLALISKMIDRPFIFISHSPPYKTPLDVLYNRVHAGSLSIRKFIEKWSRKDQLIASFHGHIHESPNRSGSISTKIEGSLCINPGQGNGNDAPFRYVIFRLSGNHIHLETSTYKFDNSLAH